MASSSPPYSINTSKAHQIPHSNPKKHLYNQQKRAHRLQSSSSIHSSSSYCSASPANDRVLTPSSSSALQGHQLSLPLLGPEFRRNRSTKVISKRNMSSNRPYFSQIRSASSAAADITSRLLYSSSDDIQGLGSILSPYQQKLKIPEDYCFVLHELGNRDKCPLKVFAFFQSSIPLMRNPTEKGKLLTTAIGVLGKVGRHDLARQVFDFGLAQGFGNTVYAYSALISAYARNGMSSEAMSILSMMKASGVRPNNISYNAVIDACGKGGVGLEVTVGFYREMLQNGICPDRKTFNSLLAGCSHAGRLGDARILFDEMIDLGIGRDIYTYNTFIDVLCKAGNVEFATEVISDMLNNNCQPTVVTYSTLMDGYAKLDRHDEALDLYMEMKSLGIQLDRICYNTLLSIYVKSGRYEEITRICEEMETMGIEKDIITYNSLITGYGKQGRFDVVSYLIREMRESGVASNVLTYSTLMDIYSKAGMYVDTANVFLDFKRSGLKADVVLYSSFIDMLAKNGFVKCAVWLLDEMTHIGIEPNVVTYNTIIDGFGKSRSFVEGCIPSGIEEGEGDCNQIVRTFGSLTKEIARPLLEEAMNKSDDLFCILGLFQRMIQQRVRPNVVTFSAILNACRYEFVPPFFQICFSTGSE